MSAVGGCLAYENLAATDPGVDGVVDETLPLHQHLVGRRLQA